VFPRLLPAQFIRFSGCHGWVSCWLTHEDHSESELSFPGSARVNVRISSLTPTGLFDWRLYFPQTPLKKSPFAFIRH
jgi:hypothetical protein